ncbi:restriction endonuclease [Pseudomonas vancouverensis]|uniref:Restriction endonuclease n=1 Tax=Pseudomonas vancouverensis TaxID=95300 RepID=A0A1H2PAN3_PSEVA|nr:restriction endonuclease [Pseudomonas vancouverensis]KAB0490158.1 restriction endonuclease [Pseudomonas vancouverensis]TDB58738.1 restriction endonuclease [Pseudomonas vancouverensis]SDV14411.1 restriction system protein [Pseudomonas vancouverensis]
MSNNWMIRAGRGGVYIEDFEKGYAAIGWSQLGDLTQYSTSASLRQEYIEIYGNDKPSATANAVAMILKFRDQITAGDHIVTYNPETREYLLGIDQGEYQYQPDTVGDYANLRKVEWLGKVSRDQLPQKAKNSLGSTLTLFSISQEIIDVFTAVLEGKAPSPLVNDTDEVETEVEQLKDETVAQSHELIKDKIVALLPDEMEELVASILRAMGYKAKVSPKGPDRGVDVIASPDGLGLTQPRIKAEVKHRNGSMGAPAIRSFIGALREGDSGLFISTGGFTREARYEAERSSIQLTLVDLDDLADLIVSHYESIDLEGRALVPLVRIYWPVS